MMPLKVILYIILSIIFFPVALLAALIGYLIIKCKKIKRFYTDDSLSEHKPDEDLTEEE
jgi:hypothetical protein